MPYEEFDDYYGEVTGYCPECGMPMYDRECLNPDCFFHYFGCTSDDPDLWR